MITKMSRRFSTLALLIGVMFYVASCEEDFRTVGVGLVENNYFSTSKYSSEVEASTVVIDELNGSGLQLEFGKLNQYLLGVYNQPYFGKLEASIASQVIKPGSPKKVLEDYGADTIVVTTMDTVLLVMPFQYTTLSSTGDPEDKYRIDSIIGNQSVSFDLGIYRLMDYLNVYDVNDPSQIATYQSNRDYNYSDLLNANTDLSFRFSVQDTMSVIKRYTADGGIYQSDSLEIDAPGPAIKIALDEDYFKTNLLDKFEGPEFETDDSFEDYFRGLFMKASGNDGALLSYSLDGAVINMYFTNTVYQESTNTPVDTIAREYSFVLGGVRANQYKRSESPVQRPEDLYLQGGSGYEVRVDLFGPDNDGDGVPDELAELRENDWLINEASLSFYIDEDVYDLQKDSVPYRLFLYRINDRGQEVQTLDVLQEGEASLFGRLRQDTIGGYWRYKLRITQYIMDLLRENPDVTLDQLGIKISNSTDYPTFVGDSLIDPYNWTGKGVVVHGPLSTDEQKRLKLEIYYSEQNN